jgi:hypothetical protein
MQPAALQYQAGIDIPGSPLSDAKTNENCRTEETTSNTFNVTRAFTILAI